MTDPINQNQGLYISVGVKATPELYSVVEAIPSPYGRRIDPAEAHVTVTFPDDFIHSGIVSADRERFERVSAAIAKRIAPCELDGAPITPLEPCVRMYRTLAGVAIDPEDATIQRINSVTAAAVKEEFGQSFTLQRTRYHLALLRRSIGAPYEEDKNQLPVLPGAESLIVEGYRVEAQAAYPDPHARKQARRAALGFTV